LGEHAELVPLVPAFDDLAVLNAGDGDAGEADGFLGGWDAGMVAGVVTVLLNDLLLDD
jgi:hypothetical protein